MPPKGCNFGHDHGPTHCGGHGNPGGGPPLKPGCCFNYWWDDKDAQHGVTNLTWPSPDNDANDYLADSFVRFLEARDGAPFMAQVSIHNCHIPYIGTNEEKAKCNSSETCNPPLPGTSAYNEAELDFYACLNEFDEAVGTMIGALKDLGYYDNTMVRRRGGRLPSGPGLPSALRSSRLTGIPTSLPADLVHH